MDPLALTFREGNLWKVGWKYENRFGKRRCTVIDGKGAKHMVTTHAQNFKNWKGTLMKNNEAESYVPERFRTRSKLEKLAIMLGKVLTQKTR